MTVGSRSPSVHDDRPAGLFAAAGEPPRVRAPPGLTDGPTRLSHSPGASLLGTRSPASPGPPAATVHGARLIPGEIAATPTASRWSRSPGIGFGGCCVTMTDGDLGVLETSPQRSGVRPNGLSRPGLVRRPGRPARPDARRRRPADRARRVPRRPCSTTATVEPIRAGRSVPPPRRRPRPDRHVRFVQPTPTSVGPGHRHRVDNDRDRGGPRQAGDADPPGGRALPYPARGTARRSPTRSCSASPAAGSGSLSTVMLDPHLRRPASSTSAPSASRRRPHRGRR